MRRELREQALLALVLAGGWVLWLQRLGINDFGDADANELMFARAPLSSVIFDIRWGDQSPLYFVVLHFWRTLGESPLTFRLLNLAIVTAVVVSLYRLALRLLDSPRLALLVALLAVVSPLSLWMVRSGRMYPLFLLFTILALDFLLLFQKTRSSRNAALLSACCVLAIYTHFFGFLTTALIFLAWFISVGRSSALVQSAAATVVLSAPQIFRSIRLLGSPPDVGVLSVSGISPEYIYQLTSFLLVNSRWNIGSSVEPVLGGAYLAGIYGLFVLGTTSLPAAERLAGVWILLPVTILGALASHIDLRDRYFLFVMPVVWIAVVNGGWGRIRLPAVLRQRQRQIEVGRRCLFAGVVAASLWLTVQKIPERGAQWTKLMHLVAQLYQPAMRLYAPPGSARGIPLVVAPYEGLDPRLADIAMLDGSTRPQFQDELAGNRDFVFLVHDGFRNEETAVRSGLLEQLGYHKTVVQVIGATAEIFTRADIPAFTKESVLPASPTREDVLAFVADRTDGSNRLDGTPRLASAFVARVHPDGRVAEGTVYANQRGEDGYWKIGPQYWDAVHDTHARSRGIARAMTYAHPAADSLLVVAFPGVTLGRRLRLVHGISDSGLFFADGAAVALDVYAGRHKLTGVMSPNTPGWKTATIETKPVAGRTETLTFFISTRNERWRHFHFSFEPQ